MSKIPFCAEYFNTLRKFEDFRHCNPKATNKQVKDFYSDNKSEYVGNVAKPFEELSKSVHDTLNDIGFSELIQTPSRGYLCEPFLQSDLKDDCWSIITPRGEGAKTTSPQLLIYTDTNRIEFGAFLGLYSSDNDAKKYHNGLKIIKRNDEVYSEFMKRINNSEFPFTQRCRKKESYLWLKSGRGIRKDGKILNWGKLFNIESTYPFPFIPIASNKSENLSLNELTDCITDAFTLVMPLFLAMSYGDNEDYLLKKMDNWLKIDAPKWNARLGINPYKFENKISIPHNSSTFNLLGEHWYENSGKQVLLKDETNLFNILSSQYE